MGTFALVRLSDRTEQRRLIWMVCGQVGLCSGD